MDEKTRVIEWLRREWDGYLEECDGVSEAFEYASGDCASDLGVDEFVVRSALRDFLAGV